MTVPCCVPATGEIGQAFAISAVYQPGSPPPAGPANIATVNATVTNPFDVSAKGKFDFSLQASKNLHGSATPDVVVYAAFDAGAENQMVQDLHGLTGPIAETAAAGGDGSVIPNPTGGLPYRNGFHLNNTNMQSRISGGVDGTFPALITPGAHSLAVRVEMIFNGLWDDPANAGDCLAFWVAMLTWTLVIPV